jgi:hypothetical protein
MAGMADGRRSPKITADEKLFIDSLAVTVVLTQIWIALCVYLLVAYLKFQSKLGRPMYQILRVLQMNLFDRRPFDELFKPPCNQDVASPQKLLWEIL